MTGDLPGLLAWAANRWLRATLPEMIQDGPWTAEVISGGLSNLTYRLRLPGGTIILRRPPLGHILPRAHDMQREYRVLSALSRTPVPVPGPLAFCADPEVLGACSVPDRPGGSPGFRCSSQAVHTSSGIYAGDFGH
jgi:aminoglycoside phosphotransferase (APT) family kinase protein